MRQWVEVKLSRVTNTPLGDEATGFATILTHVHFNVFNDTPLPLTIKKISTNVSGAESIEWKPFSVDDVTVLPPRQSYPFFVPLTLRDKYAQDFWNGKAMFTVSGEVSFVEAVGNDSVQGYGFVVRHSIDGFKILEFVGKDPTINSVSNIPEALPRLP